MLLIPSITTFFLPNYVLMACVIFFHHSSILITLTAFNLLNIKMFYLKYLILLLIYLESIIFLLYMNDILLYYSITLLYTDDLNIFCIIKSHFDLILL